MTPIPFTPPPPRPSAFVGPAVRAALASGDGTVIAHCVRRGVMDALPYALLRSPNDKPVGFPTTAHLARRLHHQRADQPVEVEERELQLPGEPRSRLMVGVWTQGLDGRRDRFLGWCWLGGRERDGERLQHALEAQVPRRFGQVG